MIDVFKFVAGIFWDYILIYLLVVAGFIFLFAFKFPQFRYFKHMFALIALRWKVSTKGKPSMLSGLILSIAGRVGTGNIVGVGAAIALGGPGVLFWMWLLAIIGMGTSILECSLAQLYKKTGKDGLYVGGPSYYIQNGLRKILGRTTSSVLAKFYAVFLLINFGIAFNGVQSFTLAKNLQQAYGVEPIYVAIITSILFLLIVSKGLKSILKSVNYMVPAMALLYIGLGLYITLTNITAIPAMLQLIFQEAFAVESVVGAGFGVIIMQGAKRGLFSNEAGLGSVPNVAVISYLKHPVEQGIIQSFSVFIDTMVICSSTAFIILLSGIDLSSLTKESQSLLPQMAFIEHLGSTLGKPLFIIVFVLFIVSTIPYNYYLSLSSVTYLTKDHPWAITGLKIACAAFIFWCAYFAADLSDVLVISDFTMGGLAIINLIALLLLTPVGKRLIFDYGKQLKTTSTPILKPQEYKDIDIEHKLWEEV